jgi:hypothetical protein
MNARPAISAQRGAITIFICMMMLIFMTMMVVTAFSMSSVNLQSVNNVQVRNEAIAAAQNVIERVIASPFTTDDEALADAALDDFGVDINGDGVFDYFVDLPQPVCVRFTRANTSVAASVQLPEMGAIDAWNTVWDLDAIATDVVTGARVRVRQGVLRLLSDAQKNSMCS